MSLAGTLLILVAMFTNKWLEGHVEASSFGSVSDAIDTTLDIGTSVLDGKITDALENNVGLFLNCKVIDFPSIIYFLLCNKNIRFDFADEFKVGDVRYKHLTKITIKVQLFWRLAYEM